MEYYWLFYSLMLISDVNSLFVTDLNVPEIIDFRDNVTISCSYDIDDQTLNSVKWYKDTMEFFRYTPMMDPTYMRFEVAGVQVSDNSYHCNESSCRIELSFLGAKSTGVYKCEVSGDAPLFKLASKADNMTVAALPQSNPLIESFKSMYRMDEFVSATCSSDYSSLPARLTWYINGEEAPLGELQLSSDTGIQAHDYTLRRQRLQVHFYVSGSRFYQSAKVLELKCVAEIENFLELRRESVLTASLFRNDNLSNQMLVHAVNTGPNGSASKGKLQSNSFTYTAATTVFVLLSTSAAWPCL